ncbi:MAG: hypothetical protein L0287_12205 [Anaerolineae bacterium]|nr:hypothetical protein [Anaerolineae bacterium]
MAKLRRTIFLCSLAVMLQACAFTRDNSTGSSRNNVAAASPLLRLDSVPLTFEIVLDTPIEGIPPGEFIVYEEYSSGDSNTERVSIYYTSWDGSLRGPLFHINYLGMDYWIASVYEVNFPSIYFEIRGNNLRGLLTVDLVSYEMQQLTYPAGCREVGWSEELEILALLCDFDPEPSQQELYFISRKNWMTVGSVNVSSHFAEGNWLGSDNYFLETFIDGSFDTILYCWFQISELSEECIEQPYQILSAVQGGEGAVVNIPPTYPEDLYYLPKNCLMIVFKDCVAASIERPEVWEDRYSVIEDSHIWISRTNRLYFVELGQECPNEGDCRETTWIWYYDFETSESIAYLMMDKYYTLWKPLLSRDESKTAIMTGMGDAEVWVIDLEFPAFYRLLSSDHSFFFLYGIVVIP